ncbi:MAG: hypothetical protein ACK4NF_06775 [Planctomycetota bacterium]
MEISKWCFYSIGKETTATLREYGNFNIVEANLPAESEILKIILSSKNNE